MPKNNIKVPSNAPASTDAESSKARHQEKIHGVGIQDADYKVTKTVNDKIVWRCPYYTTWADMLKRCYSEKFQKLRPKYKDCTVSDEWLVFSNFKKWMEAQDWLGKQLDKDILIPGNKQYSPSACCFVSQKINTLLLDCGRRKGIYPTGVSKHSNCNKFAAEFSGDMKRRKLGLFDTPEEAAKAYSIAKSNYVMKVASEQPDERIRIGLTRHAEIIRKGISA
jgi:hypothetical protein